MKIAIVTEYLAPENAPYFGGVDARTINLAKRLVKNYEVHIITTYLDETERLEDYNGVKIHRIGKKRRFTQRGDFLERLKFNSDAVSELQRLQPNIVEASGFVSYSGSYKGAKRVGVPALVTVHEVWQGEWVRNMGWINGFAGHFLERYYLKPKDRFDHYIAVSKFTKKKLIRKLEVSEEKITVVYNGVDLNLYESITSDDKYPNPTITTVCRLVAYKRVDDLIRAINKLKPDFPDIKLKIIGVGPEEKSLKELSKKLDVEENVDFLGKIRDTRNLIKILKKSHIFALPSLAEGFGMAVIEAMAAGIPYVASNIPPIREVTERGIGGFLFEPKNYNELTEAIVKLLEDEKLRGRLSKAGEELVKRKYTWDVVAREYEKIYVTLLR